VVLENIGGSVRMNSAYLSSEGGNDNTSWLYP
jgi:hypothetical protein